MVALSAFAEASTNAARPRPYDLVLFGATGDAGRVVCEYLANHQRAAAPVRWAVAGRNRAKLDGLVSALGGMSRPAVIVADSGDAKSLRAMAEQATVVLTAAGPYHILGEPVVAACVESGTHYARASCGEERRSTRTRGHKTPHLRHPPRLSRSCQHV